jgi:hypothetical protein
MQISHGRDLFLCKGIAGHLPTIFFPANFVNIHSNPGINFLGLFIVNLEQINPIHHDENSHSILHNDIFVLHGCHILCTIGKKTEKENEPGIHSSR